MRQLASFCGRVCKNYIFHYGAEKLKKEGLKLQNGGPKANIIIDKPVVRTFDSLLNKPAEYNINGRVLSHRQVREIVAAKLK